MFIPRGDVLLLASNRGDNKTLFCILKWVKQKSAKQVVSYLGGEEGNGGLKYNNQENSKQV